MSAAAFGTGDASYRAAGEADGLARLVDAFYRHMDARADARVIRAMHAAELGLVRDKLAVFLGAWLGGPSEYRARYGPISIPAFHAPYAIDEAERDAWLRCMAAAVAEQPWSEAFKAYFLRAIAVPAERVRVASVARRAGEVP